ncbi:hypothetical protein VFPPC_08916 [Pochonia chlamydosporia 170]|uniref:Uncharacterized protein n=1 Tax=Pochonia chlamydosporia 170 TaxID=1380566 RepID=A0A179FCJ1_METCM|nr:hypothetical protein VFPPC_08916 [Pochonia chlamydosporia 170]OAQ63001.1 hypothetical protein VFPPC_08916 [Pochonia chlamydosporia 170]
MALKRKRSEPELCSSPSSSSSIFSSPPNHPTLHLSPQTFHNMPAPHLNSRTLKRFRDNRPSEEQVHQHTLNLLFSAQQQPRDKAFQPPSQTSTTPQGKQQSLHRFWNINSTPTPTSMVEHAIAPSSCEDCGAGLGNGVGDGMDVDFMADSAACGACGKYVCFSCSVSNLGEERRCLQCAGRKGSWDVGWGSGLSCF